MLKNGTQWRDNVSKLQKKRTRFNMKLGTTTIAQRRPLQVD